MNGIRSWFGKKKKDISDKTDTTPAQTAAEPLADAIIQGEALIQEFMQNRSTQNAKAEAEVEDAIDKGDTQKDASTSEKTDVKDTQISAKSETPSGPEAEAEPSAEAGNILSKLTSGLKRSSSKFSDGIVSVFNRQKLDEETLEDLEDLLIMSDMGANAARKITERIQNTRFEKDISPDAVKATIASEIADILSPREKKLDLMEGPRPRIVLFVGVNGSGKTTTIGKIAAQLSASGLKTLIVAADTFRAAAIEQLTVWADRAGFPIMAEAPGADAAGLVHDAMMRAKRDALDLVLIDTAGRLQNKDELMSELAKIIRVIQKLDPDAPHDVLMVLDATVGQNALSQVEAFRHSAGITGLVMTKLD